MKKFINFLSTGILLACLTVSLDVYAQPANDECANAMDISSLFDGACNVSNLSMVIDNTGATGNVTDPPEPGESPTCPQTDDTNLFGDGSTVMETSVWFTFTVPDLNGDGSDVSYSLWTSDGSYGDCGLNPNNILAGDADTQVAIYESNTCPDNTLGECDYFAANEDLFTSAPWISGWLDLMFTPGQTYYMLIDTWDGVVGEFCLSVTPCGTLCGDGSCAPVESFCDCNGDCACDFANFGLIRYDPVEDGYFFTEDLTETVALCSQFLGANSDNIYLGVGASNFTPCGGTASEMTITYDNGNLVGGPFDLTGVPSGSTIPTGTLFYFELTPADVTAGSITFNGCVDDGLGGQCCQDLVLDFSTIPAIADPYCVLTCFAGDIDPNLLNQTVCEDGTIQLCADGMEDLTLPCNSDDGSSYQFGWQVMGLVYGAEFDLTNFVLQPSACETVLVADIFIDQFGYVPPNFTPGAPLPLGTYTVQGAAFCVNSDGTTVEACATPSIMTVTLQAAGTCPVETPGCTDPCDPNYDANATVNDPALCAGYDDTCNADCTLGPFGGTWDAATCACINETTPVTGCTDAAACNYDAAANCDDASCDSGNAACADPCNPVMGCTDAAACNYDANACVDDASCDLGNPACADPCNEVAGCTDPVACNYDPAACVDDATCDLPDGCTDAAACNYNPAAICDDGSCDLTPGCANPDACNFDVNACVDDGSCDLGNTACVDPCNEPNPDDGCDLTADSFDAATCTVTNAPNCPAGTTFNAGTCNCDTDVIMGCTDFCADNFDPAANMDDGTCNPYDDTCNADCTTGPFGGTWDATTCGCINETTPANGCTDASANNYDATANCDDGSCIFSNPGCTDACADNFDPNADTDDGSCNPYDDTCNADCTVGPFGGTWDAATCGCINETTPANGCTDSTAANYDANANCDDGSCIPDPGCTAVAATISGGPFQFCVNDGTPDFVSGITVTGGAGANTAWVITDDLLNILALPSTIDEVDFDGAGFGICLIWYVTYEDIAGAEVGMNAADLTGCFALSNSIEVIREDCTDPCTAAAATISGGPFQFCVNDGTPDFVSGITVTGGAGTNTAWVITDDQLNILGLPGMPGEVDFDGAGLGTCLIWYVTFEDIAGAEVGMNAADLTGCYALSNSIEVVREDCGTCEDEISGSIDADMGCDVAGSAVLITDAAGNPIGMAIADANGDYTLSGGPFACGDYIATLDVASLPACYVDAGGDVGPAGFTVNGDGTSDGANFSAFDEVPTLSQWGLMTLALLLMTFGALKLGFVNNVQTSTNKRK